MSRKYFTKINKEVAKMFTLVKSGQKALIIRPSEKREIVQGPRVIFTFFTIRGYVLFFREIIVKEGEGGYLVDENHRYTRVERPGHYYVHPEGGMWIPTKTRVEIAPDETVAISDGESGFTGFFFVRGKERSFCFISPEQKVYRLTSS